MVTKMKQETRNYVAKHSQKSGAGAHVSKSGKFAPRCKQKRRFKRELKYLF